MIIAKQYLTNGWVLLYNGDYGLISGKKFK
jgi:hypothetical protein